MNFISTKNGIIIVKEKKSKKLSFAFWFFLGILIFLAIWLPLYGMTLKYRTGSVFKEIFNTTGTLLLIFGGLFLMWGFLSLLCGRKLGGLKLMLLGIVLVYFGMLFIHPALIGLRTSGKEVPQGYH